MNNPSIKRNLNIEYRWNDKQYLSHENFVKLLKQFGDLLPDPMSERVNLDEYSEKWSKHADILLAFDKNKIVGIKVLYANDQKTKSAHGLLLSILPEYQGQGIGRQMDLLSIKLAKQRDLTKISLFVHYENRVAIKLYTSLGFKEIKRKFPKIKMQLDII